ncbi:putative RNA recognition motif domain, nucleotide-binding alpha-beta plait domain superfamily [Plasmopara halstedii]
MGRRDEEGESSRRHGRHRASLSPTRGVDHEEAIRNKLRESGWKKRRMMSDSMADAETSKDYDKAKDRADPGSPRTIDERRSAKGMRISRRSRSSRRRDREHRTSRRKSSGSRRRSPSRSPASRSHSRSRSTSRRHRRHISSSKKHRSSRSPSHVLESKRSRRGSSRSPSTSLSNKKKTLLEDEKREAMKVDEMESESGGDVDMKTMRKKDGGAKKEIEEKNEDRYRSRKSSRRSRSGSPRSPSRPSRRRRHRRSSYSRSHSPSRSHRARHGGSRSRSRSPPRDRRPRGRDRDRRSRRRGRSYSNSPSYTHRHRRTDRSSSRDRLRHDGKPPAEISTASADVVASNTTATSPTAPTANVNPTITQLMAQYPTMSLQDIIAKMQASNVTMAAAVAQKPARELYVGNLPPSVTGPQLQEFLSTIIQQVGLTTKPGNPIVNTWISTDGHFAFCEMRSVEECNLALLLNQLSLLGQPLKFGRPRSFMGPPQPMPQVSARTQTALTNLGCTPNPAWFAQPVLPGSMEVTTTESTLAEATLSAIAAAQSASASGAGSEHRLIMSNIPVVLTESQVKELVEPFGKLKTFTLIKDPATGTSLGNALFEYEDSSVAAQAMEGLNGLSIGGILLSVQRQPPASGAGLGAFSSAITKSDEQPSAALKMTNMVSIDELRDDDEYADLAEDVEEECKRFGSVVGMEIPRPKEGEDVPGLGCIYVRFGKQEEAVSALKALNGRKFGGNIVNVTYFPFLVCQEVEKSTHHKLRRTRYQAAMMVYEGLYEERLQDVARPGLTDNVAVAMCRSNPMNLAFLLVGLTQQKSQRNRMPN